MGETGRAGAWVPWRAVGSWLGFLAVWLTAQLVAADTVLADTVLADTLRADTVLADTLLADTLRAGTARAGTAQAEAVGADVRLEDVPDRDATERDATERDEADRDETDVMEVEVSYTEGLPARLFSLHGGQTLAPGQRVLVSEMGWPGLAAGLRWGVSDGFEVGLELGGFVASPVMGLSMGLGGRLRMPLRVALGRVGRWSFGWAFAPSVASGAAQALGDVDGEAGELATAWGVGLQGLVGFDVTPAFTLAAGVGPEVVWAAPAPDDLHPWALPVVARLVTEGRLSSNTLLYLRGEAGYGWAAANRFGGSGIFRLFVGAAVAL